MNTDNTFTGFYSLAAGLFSVMILSGCSSESDISGVEHDKQPVVSMARSSTTPVSDFLFDPSNPHFLFDVTEHSTDELHALLNRINEIAESGLEDYINLEIIMILHGPDINLFTYRSYEANKSLVDLAAKLDAFNIIDMKVCATVLPELGVSKAELPAFIEVVPYAPHEIERLVEKGYISL
jgi:hypothetical protein